MRHLLIVETEYAGHRANHVEALMVYAAANQRVGSVTFAISRELEQRLDANVLLQLGGTDGRVRIRCLTPSELFNVGRPRWATAKSICRWRLAMRIAKEQHATAVLFLILDEVAAAAAFMSKTGLRISGIYFRPTAHYPETWRGPGRFMRQSLKQALVKRFLDRKDSTALLTFDPYFPEFARNKYRNGAKVRALPEPVESLEASTYSRSRRSLPVRFLLFGALQRRKGIEEFLASLETIAPSTLSSAAFSICGVGELEALVRDRVAKLAEEGVAIRFENRFLSRTELDAECRQADVILAPYQDHIGSSGVLYIAAALRKPVITQSTGLVGRQVREYCLGEAIETSYPTQIARAIETLTAQFTADAEPGHAKYAEFVVGHGREQFARVAYDAA